MQTMKHKVIALIIGLMISASLFYMTTLKLYVVQGETIMEINTYSIVFVIVSGLAILEYLTRKKKNEDEA